MSTAGSTGRHWMVLLEAADDRPRSAIDPAQFRRMMSSWPAARPAALFSPCRYALQVSVTAPDAQSALATAIALWGDALRRAGLPEWPLVRIETVTIDEFESDFLVSDGALQGAGEAADPLSSTVDPDSDDLLRRALHDAVTGLPGRELFIDQVRESLAGASGPAVRAVMVVDVDGPDLPACEEVMVELAGRLKDAVRREDLVGRVGAAEFALLVTVASGEDIDRVAARIVANVRSPILDDGPSLSVTVSVGVARTSPGADADRLILMAQVATEVAKEAGGDCHSEYAARSDSI